MPNLLDELNSKQGNILDELNSGSGNILDELNSGDLLSELNSKPAGLLETAAVSAQVGTSSLVQGLAGIESAAGRALQKIPGLGGLGRTMEKVGTTVSESIQKGAEEIMSRKDYAGNRKTMMIMQNLGANLPVMAAGVALGPAGAIPTLATMASVAAGNKYNELTSKGASHEDATIGAVGQGIIEMVTERLPLGELFTNAPFLKKAFYYGLKELAGEEVATLGEAAINKGVVGETFADLPQKMWDTAIVTAGSAGPTVAITNGIQKLSNKFAENEKKISEPVVPPTPAPAPEAPAAVESKATTTPPSQAAAGQPSAIPTQQTPVGGTAYGRPLPQENRGTVANPRMVTRAAKIGLNLDKIEADYDTKFFINKLFEDNYLDFAEAKGAPVRNADTVVAAAKLVTSGRMTEADVLNEAKREGWTMEQQQAARMIAMNASIKANELSKKSAASGTQQDSAIAMEAANKAYLLDKSVSLSGTETARKLQAFNIMAKAAENLREKIGSHYGSKFPSLLSRLRGKTLNSEVIEKLAMFDPNDTVTISKFIEALPKVTTADKLYEAWVNGILSGIPTHERNVIGTGLMMALEPARRGAAAAVELGVSTVKGGPREAYFGEVPATLYGTGAGIWQGAKTALRVFNTELTDSEMASFDEKKGTFNVGALEGKVGRIARVPTRFIKAADAMTETMSRSGAVYAEAYRAAAKQGLKGEALIREALELASKPTPEIAKKAQATAEYNTFKKQLGEWGTNLMRLRDTPVIKIRGGVELAPGKMAMPFLKTPINVGKAAVEHTPFGFLKIIGPDITRQNFSDEMAAPLVGTAIFSVAYMLAKSGLITGNGPKDPKEKQRLYAAGWQPQSILIGDEYHPFRGHAPVSQVLAMAADMAETTLSEDEFNKKAAGVVGDIATNLASQPFTSGLENILNSVMDPERYGDNYVKMLAGSAVPAFVPNITRSVEKKGAELKQTKTLGDVMKERLPNRDELEPRLYLLGEPQTKSGGPWERLIFGQGATKKDTGIYAALNELGVQASAPAKIIRRDGLKYEMTPKEYNDYIIAVAGRVKPLIQNIIDNKSATVEGKEAQKKTIESIISQFREAEMSKRWFSTFKSKAVKDD